MDPGDNDRCADLIQRIVDGEATLVERAELDALMLSSAPTRAEYEALRDLVRRLDTYPLAESPELKDEILDKLRGRAVVSFHTRKRRAVFGLAWAAAAAVIMGIALDQWRDRQGVNPGDAGASMTQPVVNGAGAPFTAWPVIFRETSDNTTLTVRASGDKYAFTVAPVREDTSLIWEPQQLTFADDAAGSGYDVANKKSGVATFSAPAAHGTVVLRRVRDSRGPVSVSVSRSGQEILKKSIPLN